MSSITDLTNPNVEIIGHRGHFSAYPENTMEGFLSAVALGADAVEMDLVISADQKVVVSHEPYMKASYMTTPKGKRIEKKKERDYNLYRMTYDSIKEFKSGRLPNAKFRNQKKTNAHKPLLKSVLDTIESFSRQRNLKPVKFYLEIKSDPPDYNIFQPQPNEFVALVMQLVAERKLEDRVILMSFDSNILKAIKQNYPKITVSYLLYTKGIEEGLKELDFQPDVLSPYYKQLNDAVVISSLQEQGIKIIPWTVNRKKDILKMFELGVDGIITDYPERMLREKNRLQKK